MEKKQGKILIDADKARIGLLEGAKGLSCG